MAQRHLSELLGTVRIIDTPTVNAILADGDITKLEALFLTMRPKDYSLLKTLRRCRNVYQAEILLRNKNYTIKRSHNELLMTIESEEIVEFLLNHQRCRFNPGYKNSLPLLHAVRQQNERRVRMFLHTRRCDIHAWAGEKTILQLALESPNQKIVDLMALVYDNTLAERVEYNSDELEKINFITRVTRARLCREQHEAKCEIKTFIECNKRAQKLTELCENIIASGISERVANDILCPDSQVRQTRHFIAKIFYS
jgi:hypothetical protein